MVAVKKIKEEVQDARDQLMNEVRVLFSASFFLLVFFFVFSCESSDFYQLVGIGCSDRPSHIWKSISI